MYIEIRAAYRIQHKPISIQSIHNIQRLYGFKHTPNNRQSIRHSAYMAYKKQSIKITEHTEFRAYRTYTGHLAKITYTTYTYQSISRTANTEEEIKRRQHRTYTVGIAYNIQSKHHTD